MSAMVGSLREGLMKRAVAAAAGLALAGSGWAGYGSAGSGGSAKGAAFLTISPSVKGESLGGMNPAASSGAQAMGVNPANLSDVPAPYEFTSGLATMIGGSEYGTAGLAVKREGGLSVGGAVTFLQSGPLEGRDASGNLTSDFQSRDMAAGITVGTGGEAFRAGVTAKAVRQEIGAFTSNTVPAADLGLSLKTGSIQWGAAALNLGPGIKFQGETAGLPTTYSLGASVSLGGGMTGLVGAAQVAGQMAASLGVDYRLGPVSVRMGYRSAPGTNLAMKSQKGGAQALDGVTGGIGIAFKSLQVDYSVSQTAVEYGMSQRAAVTFRWGGGEPAPREKPARQEGASSSTGAGVKTGSHRAYDPQPVKAEPKKRWVD